MIEALKLVETPSASGWVVELPRRHAAGLEADLCLRDAPFEYLCRTRRSLLHHETFEGLPTGGYRVETSLEDFGTRL